MFKTMSNSEIIQHLTEEFNEVEEAHALLSLNLKHMAHYPFISDSFFFLVFRDRVSLCSPGVLELTL
jgi:hypothetical protein